MLSTFLDEDPWLNDTTACTVPSPWEPPTVHDNNDNRWQTEAAYESAARASETQLNINLDAYVGDYEHPGFGTFSVYKDGSETLRYEFGLLLSGILHPSNVTDLFFMELDPPLDYQMTFYPNLPNGPPTNFISNPVTSFVEGITVPYMQLSFPPTFTRNQTFHN